jgi:putative glutamine amidotransferase
MRPRIAIPQPHSGRPEYNQRALPQYVEAVERAGGEAVVVDLALSNQEIARLATTCDGVLLPGSPADVDPEKYGAAQRHEKTAAADPRRDNADELLLQDAFNMRKPLLGICYGVQSLNVWRTGTLVQHIENHSQGRAVREAHAIEVEPGSLLAEILSGAWRPGTGGFQAAGSMRGQVNSSHHQSVERPGDGLRVVARSEKDRVVEAVEGTAPDHFVLGVQWHPERTADADAASQAIFEAFVEAARERHENPRAPVTDFETLGR